MTNRDVLEIAMRQSAIESGCDINDFLSNINKIVLSRKHPQARKYIDLPYYCDLTSYGNCIVASVSEELQEVVSEYIGKYSVEHCFETPNMLVLQEKLKPFDLNICFMAEYFLPDTNILKPLECDYELKVLNPDEFSVLYKKEFANAISDQRKKDDRLVVAAFDNGRVIGMAGCSEDCESMWQIGVDVLPDYRRQGIAAAVTSNLAIEIFKRGKVSFYCAAWSNIKSVRNAIKSGFRPAWVQLTAKKHDFIDKFNDKSLF